MKIIKLTVKQINTTVLTANVVKIFNMDGVVGVIEPVNASNLYLGCKFSYKMGDGSATDFRVTQTADEIIALISEINAVEADLDGIDSATFDMDQETAKHVQLESDEDTLKVNAIGSAQSKLEVDLIDGATINDVTIENTLWVDGNRVDDYTADGGISRPFKTVLAALTVINADAGKSWVVNVAPGTYADNLTITSPRHLRIEGMGGVVLSGTILINSGVGSYDRIEFVGVKGVRAEKGPALTISGKITATRTNDSLIYVGFHGCLVSGQFEATTNGTWVLQYSNSRIAGAITGTFASNTQRDASILIEAYGLNEFVGTVSGIVSFYNCNQASIYSNINTTPWFENRFYDTTFAGSVSIVPQVGASSALVYVDATSYKSLAARTPTLTGATYSHLQGTMAVQDSSNVSITGGNAALTTLQAANSELKAVTFRDKDGFALFQPSFTPVGTITVNADYEIIPQSVGTYKVTTGAVSPLAITIDEIDTTVTLGFKVWLVVDGGEDAILTTGNTDVGSVETITFKDAGDYVVLYRGNNGNWGINEIGNTVDPSKNPTVALVVAP